MNQGVNKINKMNNLIMFFEKVSTKGRVGHVIEVSCHQFIILNQIFSHFQKQKNKQTTLTNEDEQKQKEHIYNESRSK